MSEDSRRRERQAAETASRAAEKDWARIRARLQRAGAALDESQQLSPERARTILHERAQQLAAVPVRTLRAADRIEVLVFALAGEQYAIETRFIREVLRFRDYTSVPGTPDFLIGVTNLRGQILGLFDLRRLFGIAAQDSGDGNDTARIIVMGGDRAEFGIRADAVFEVARLCADQVLAPADSPIGPARDVLRGVTEKALILLDGDLLLKEPRLVIDEAGE